jgi:hypothetical protein
LPTELLNENETSSLGESLVLLSAIETVLGELYAGEVLKFHLQVTLWEEEYWIFQKTFVTK